MKVQKTDVLVIGGGAGGLTVTSVAAQLGLKTVLVEKSPQLGGDCLHTGCVPSKTLIHHAKNIWQYKNATQYGLKVEPKPCYTPVSEKVSEVIEHIQQHDDPKRFESYGAKVIFGTAQFKSPHRVAVGDDVFQAKKIFIAAGSSPFIPPILGIENLSIETNETIFNLQSQPKSLLVIGGGAIGVELAQAFNRLGTRVTIVEAQPRLLMPFDPDISETLEKSLTQEGVFIYTNAEIQEISQADGQTLLSFRLSTKETLTRSFDKVLIATGRKANVRSLSCEAADIPHSDKGIQVNHRLQAGHKHIYAIGDIVDSPYKFTHMAEYHAGIAIANGLFKARKQVKHNAVPSVVFSDPECAMVGLTEAMAKDRKINYQPLQFHFSENDRAITSGDGVGFIKLLIRKNKVIGASLIGPDCAELVSELTLAISAGLTLSDISNTIHAYPTLSQIHRRCVNTYYAPKLFNWKTKALVKVLNLF